MSEDEARKAANTEEPEDEVEAHHRRAGANAEAPTEGEDDVEAHRMHKNRANKN